MQFRGPLGVLILGIGSGIFFAPGSACGQGPVATPCSLEQLTRMSWDELEQLYRQANPGTFPCGYARGRAIYSSDKKLSRPRSAVSRLLWKGKHFREDGTIINQWLGGRAVRARVYEGESLLDGCPSIILDYAGMSRVVWTNIRDELREVGPGLYLGIMYDRRDPCRYRTFFVLEVCQACH